MRKRKAVLCIHIHVFLAWVIPELNVCIYLCKYIPTLFNNIHEYHVQKEELWHMSPWKKINIASQSNISFDAKKLSFLRFFPQIPQGSWFAKALHHSALPRKGHSPDPKKRKSPAHRHDCLIQRWTVTVERTVTASSNVFFFGFWKKHKWF